MTWKRPDYPVSSFPHFPISSLDGAVWKGVVSRLQKRGDGAGDEEAGKPAAVAAIPRLRSPILNGEREEWLRGDRSERQPRNRQSAPLDLTSRRGEAGAAREGGKGRLLQLPAFAALAPNEAVRLGAVLGL